MGYGLLFRIAARNLMRHVRRTLLTGSMIAGGFALAAAALGIVNGSYGHLIAQFTLERTGHLQIHAKGYLDQASIYTTIDHPAAAESQLAADPEVYSWAPRVKAAAMAFEGSKAGGAEVVGIDPAKEAATTTLRARVREGAYLAEDSRREAVIGPTLAETLAAKVGDQLILLSQGADGSVANGLFKIRGILSGGADAADGMSIYLPLSEAQDFFSLGDRLHEIAVRLKDPDDARAQAARIGAALASDPSTQMLVADPWQVVEAQFYREMQADRAGSAITYLVVMTLVALGVLNTVLMSVFERTREFGLLKALGTRPGDVFRLVVIENALLALFGSLAGAVLTAGLCGYLSRHGILLPTPFEIGSMRFDRLVSDFDARLFLVPAALTIATAVLVSVFPAARAARILPIRALRAT